MRERLYLAALNLTVGKVNASRELILTVKTDQEEDTRAADLHQRLGKALQRLIAAVKFERTQPLRQVHHIRLGREVKKRHRRKSHQIDRGGPNTHAKPCSMSTSDSP